MTNDKLDELERLLKAGTPGPWMLATSNSWRRFVSKTHTPVCEPIVQNDGHPDLHFRNGGPDGPDAALITAAINALPELVARVREFEELKKDMSLVRVAAYYALSDREVIVTDKSLDEGRYSHHIEIRREPDHYIVRRAALKGTPT
jgi:hypothetical protein